MNNNNKKEKLDHKNTYLIVWSEFQIKIKNSDLTFLSFFGGAIQVKNNDIQLFKFAWNCDITNPDQSSIIQLLHDDL